MERLNPQSRRDQFGSRINRTQSPLLAYGVPWLTIMLGSLTPWLPVIAPAPVIPPLGFLMLIAWRLLRPGLLPLWAGFPLGLFDDLYSGQPLGSGILLFSAALFAIELIEMRLPWRSFWLDWLTVAGLVAGFLLLAALFSGVDITSAQLSVIGAQALLSVMLFPIAARAVALLDRLRLMRVRRLS